MIQRKPIRRVRSKPRRGQPAFETLPDGREVCAKNHAGRQEYFPGQGASAALPDRHLERTRPVLTILNTTFDHEQGRGMGGSRRDDRIEIDGKWINAAVTSEANFEKGSKRYHWVEGVYIEVHR